MIFSVVSKNGIEWSLDFGPDSVTLTIKDLVQEKIVSSKEVPVEASSLFLSQKQDILNNHLARVPTAPNQEENMAYSTSSNYPQPRRQLWRWGTKCSQK